MKWNYYRRFWHNSNEVSGQTTNVWNASVTDVTSSEDIGTRVLGTRTLSTITFTSLGERGTNIDFSNDHHLRKHAALYQWLTLSPLGNDILPYKWVNMIFELHRNPKNHYNQHYVIIVAVLDESTCCWVWFNLRCWWGGARNQHTFVEMSCLISLTWVMLLLYFLYCCLCTNFCTWVGIPQIFPFILFFIAD